MQEKNITFPTDAKLLVKIVDWCQKESRAEGLVLRQTYRNEMKELKRVMRFRGRAKSKKAVARADRRLRTIAGRLCRELDRLLDADSPWRERLKISLMFINGEKLDGHKIYSLHERHACRRRIQLQKSHEGSFCDHFYNVPTIVGGNNSPPRDVLCKISPVVGFCERKGTKPWNSRQSGSLPNASF